MYIPYRTIPRQLLGGTSKLMFAQTKHQGK